MSNDLPEYIKDTDVPKLLPRAVQSLRNDRSMGRGLPYIRIGRSVYYSVKDVREYLEKHKIKHEKL